MEEPPRYALDGHGQAGERIVAGRRRAREGPRPRPTGVPLARLTAGGAVPSEWPRRQAEWPLAYMMMIPPPPVSPKRGFTTLLKIEPNRYSMPKDVK